MDFSDKKLLFIGYNLLENEFELNYLVNDMHSKFIFLNKSKDIISSVDFGDNEVEFYG